jgi:hypothetical protein
VDGTVEVVVAVDVDDVDGLVLPVAAQRGRRDRVGPADDNREDASIDDRAERPLDAPEVPLEVALADRYVAGVDHRDALEELAVLIEVVVALRRRVSAPIGVVVDRRVANGLGGARAPVVRAVRDADEGDIGGDLARPQHLGRAEEGPRLVNEGLGLTEDIRHGDFRSGRPTAAPVSATRPVGSVILPCRPVVKRFASGSPRDE